ncbi:hypothetical protein [Longimicrobium sp.]|uniref:hypothetical protein n=1 Tax=Longimicrobium sp. TaxID=2029185 RepID=UPI002ED896EC
MLKSSSVAVLGILLLAAAAANAAGPSTQARQSQVPQERDLRTLDERFSALNRQIPGFGGYYRGENGNFVVFLTEPAVQQVVALQVLTPVLTSIPVPGRLNLTQVPQILVRQGRFTFDQLDGFRNQARDAVLGLDGLVSVGVHPAQNRVWIGVRDTAARDRVQAAVAAMNIPGEAFVVEVVGTARLDQTLTLRQAAPVVHGDRDRLHLRSGR